MKVRGDFLEPPRSADNLNYDVICFQQLNGIMELFDYKNLIKEATCFKKDCLPNLNDVILTNIRGAFGKFLARHHNSTMC